MQMSDNANSEIEVLQDEAKERLSLDPLPDFINAVVTLPNNQEVQAELYKQFYVYCDRNGKIPSTSWNVSHLATGKTIVVHSEIPDGGLNNRQAKRLAVWLSPLDWSVDANNRWSAETNATVDALVEAYADKNHVLVEEIVARIDGRRLNAPDAVAEKVSGNLQPVVDSKQVEAYTTGVSNQPPMTENQSKDRPMSATAEMPNGVQTATTDAPKKKRRQRNINSAAALKRPGIMMKPVAAFNAKEVETLANDFGEKVPLVYATAILVLLSLPDEQKLEAFKQAKLANVAYTREERAKQNVPS